MGKSDQFMFRFVIYNQLWDKHCNIRSYIVISMMCSTFWKNNDNLKHGNVFCCEKNELKKKYRKLVAFKLIGRHLIDSLNT